MVNMNDDEGRSTVRIGIVGAGAIGGNVGGMLAHAGFDVTLVDQWPEHVVAIKENGLIVERRGEELLTHPVALHIHELQFETVPFDWVFVAVKARDTEWSTMLMMPYLAEGGTVVDFQNGINDERVAAIAGAERTMGAVITIGAGCYEPGKVVRTDSNPVGFKVGELDGSDSERAHELASIMNHVENTEVTTDLIGERWSKLIINNMNNAIAGLTGLGAAEVRTTSEPRRVSIHLGAETAQVAQAFGHSLQPVMGVTADSLIDAINGRNVEETETAIMESGRYVAGGRPSFGQDVLKGRSTEIDDLNGYVSRKGREAGISTPFNDRIVEIVHELGIGFEARPENLQPLIDMLEG